MRFINFRKYKQCITYIGFLACFIILTNIAIISHIKNEQKYQELLRLSIYQKLVQEIIINNIDILTKVINVHTKDIDTQISVIKNYIKNQVFIPYFSSNSELHNKKLGYINLQELLDELADQKFYYAITINNLEITKNGIMDHSISLSEQYKITNELLLNISIQLNSNSAYVEDASKRVNEQILILIKIASITFIFISLIIYYLINKSKKIKCQLEELELNFYEAMERNKNILLFHETNKIFILKCYEYSKNILNKNQPIVSLKKQDHLKDNNYNNDYLPLPLILQEDKRVFFYEIILQPTISTIQNYYKGYVAYYNVKLNLEIKNIAKRVTVPFDKELFEQLFISLFCNMLYFNKSTLLLKYIKLIIKKNMIICSSNGFLLHHDLAIKYSEKIFNDTGNLYLLNLGQIFSLIKRHRLSYKVDIENQETVIRIKLKDTQTFTEQSKNREIEVIDLNRFKKEREFK